MATKVASAAKKTAVKKVAKKVVSKSSGATTKKVQVFADSSHAFWVSDGQILNSLGALEQALTSMSSTVYGHHVSKDKHDFADWVDIILCDSVCAFDLRKAKTPKAAHTVVAKHLKSYTK